MRFRAVIWTIAIVAAQGFGRPPQASVAGGIEGDWQGTLRSGSNGLRLAVHISRAPQGFLQGTVDSLDEDAYGIPMTSITFENSKLVFSADSIEATYEGHANPDVSVISGSWSQAGRNFTLELRRGAAPDKSGH